jgi:tRNA A-37 threonylcarbamoyl transferase component Bud32
MTAMKNEQLELAILNDVVNGFVHLNQSTARRALLIKYKNRPAAEVLQNIVNNNIIRRKGSEGATTDEEYLPTAAAFELCGDTQLLEEAKNASAVVLYTLQQMFVGDPRKEGYAFNVLKEHAALVFPNHNPDDATLKLGLYLARDLHALMGHRMKLPDQTEVEWFQIAETVANLPNPDREWDRAMTGYRPSSVSTEPEGSEGAQWEQIRRLGGGGQSEVFLVRSPARVAQRAECLRKIRAALDQNQRADLADAMWLYARPDSVSELGAMKRFKIRDDEQQSLDRLKQEVQILKQNRPGLPKLLDSNESERWMVTEYFPEGTLEDNILRYKGKPDLALRAFLSLVNTVKAIHADDIVHRDIKPANVFVRSDEELVLGDFGIVFVPDQPVRLTRTDESVGPHDYMPPWGELGTRLEKVHPNFDVYMLGKLLWCMVSGRLLLRREWFKQPQNDISLIFKDDPRAYVVNTILEKCVVEHAESCLSITDLRAMVIAFVHVFENGGQPLGDGVPRICHVCGFGLYEREIAKADTLTYRLTVSNSDRGADTSTLFVQFYICDRCGHVELFRMKSR